MVFLVVAMLLGVFTQHVLGFTRIPYTNLLLVKLHDTLARALVQLYPHVTCLQN